MEAGVSEEQPCPALLLLMHTNGLASHPRQPLLLLSSLSSHTRLSLRSTCSPHSRHAHATEPLSTHACCLRVSAHTDTCTCLVLTLQPPPNRTSASPPQHNLNSMTPGSEVGRREGLLPVSDPLQLAGLGGRERWREGQRVSIWDKPLWQQEGRGSPDRRAQVSCQGRGGQQWPP